MWWILSILAIIAIAIMAIYAVGLLIYAILVIFFGF